MVLLFGAFWLTLWFRSIPWNFSAKIPPEVAQSMNTAGRQEISR